MKIRTVVATLLAVSLFALLPTSVIYAQKAGLVLHLAFDDGKGDKAEDSSGNGNDAIIYGNAEWVEGKFGKAILFDGVDDYMEVPLKPSITFSTGDSLSVQAWIKSDDSPTQNDGILGNYRDSTEALWMLSMSGDNVADRGKCGFNVRDVGKNHSAGVKSPNPLNDGQWHHLVGIRDQTAKKVRFYLDGALIDEVDDQTEDINSKQSIWIGEHLQRYYKGVIDDVKIWNRPISDTEVTKSMAGPTSVNPLGKLTTAWGYLKETR